MQLSCRVFAASAWCCKKRKRNKAGENYLTEYVPIFFLPLLFPKEHKITTVHTAPALCIIRNLERIKIQRTICPVMCDECTVSFKRLEHPQILTSVGGPRPNMPWRQRVNSILPSGNNCSKLSAVRCGTHWYLNCSCTDAAIC